MALRHLRHGPTLLWGTTCVVLAVVLGAAGIVGKDGPIEGRATPVERTEEAMRAASSIRTQMQPLLTLAAGDGEGLSGASMAIAREARRLGRGAVPQLHQALMDVAERAEELAAVDPADRDALNAGVMNLSIAVDRLSAVATGAGVGAGWVNAVETAGEAPGGADPDLVDPQFENADPAGILDAG